MGIWNTGSVAEAVWDYVDTIPARTSGALPSIAERHLSDLQKFNNVSISASNISESYQNYVLYATLCDVYSAKEDAGTDASDVKLGEFSVKKGKGSSAASLSAYYCDKADVELYRIGINSGFRQVFG